VKSAAHGLLNMQSHEYKCTHWNAAPASSIKRLRGRLPNHETDVRVMAVT